MYALFKHEKIIFLSNFFCFSSIFQVPNKPISFKENFEFTRRLHAPEFSESMLEEPARFNIIKHAFRFILKYFVKRHRITINL